MRTTIKERVDVRVCGRCHREVRETSRGALHGWASANGEYCCVNGQEPHVVVTAPRFAS